MDVFLNFKRAGYALKHTKKGAFNTDDCSNHSVEIKMLETFSSYIVVLTNKIYSFQ